MIVISWHNVRKSVPKKPSDDMKSVHGEFIHTTMRCLATQTREETTGYSLTLTGFHNIPTSSRSPVWVSQYTTWCYQRVHDLSKAQPRSKKRPARKRDLLIAVRRSVPDLSVITADQTYKIRGDKAGFCAGRLQHGFVLANISRCFHKERKKSSV